MPNLLCGCTLDFAVFTERKTHHRFPTVTCELMVVCHAEALVLRVTHSVIDPVVVVGYEFKVRCFYEKTLVIDHAPLPRVFFRVAEVDLVVFL